MPIEIRGKLSAEAQKFLDRQLGNPGRRLEIPYIVVVTNNNCWIGIPGPAFRFLNAAGTVTSYTYAVLIERLASDNRVKNIYVGYSAAILPRNCNPANPWGVPCTGGAAGTGAYTVRNTEELEAALNKTDCIPYSPPVYSQTCEGSLRGLLSNPFLLPLFAAKPDLRAALEAGGNTLCAQLPSLGIPGGAGEKPDCARLRDLLRGKMSESLLDALYYGCLAATGGGASVTPGTPGARTATLRITALGQTFTVPAQQLPDGHYGFQVSFGGMTYSLAVDLQNCHLRSQGSSDMAGIYGSKLGPNKCEFLVGGIGSVVIELVGEAPGGMPMPYQPLPAQDQTQWLVLGGIAFMLIVGLVMFSRG